MSVFKEQPLVIIDFETTGMNPEIHDIIEIGAIRVRPDTLEVLTVCDWKIAIDHWDTIQVPALRHNGYSPDAWKDALKLPEALDAFRYYAYGGILCSWKITFEYHFLCEAFRRAEMVNPFIERRVSNRIDLPSMVWALHPEFESLSYDKVADALGISPEPKPHRAINGAYQDLKILRRLRGLKDE